MTKHNKRLTSGERLARHPQAIKNQEGALAFDLELREKFLNLAGTCYLMRSQFYRSGTERMAEIVKVTEDLAKTDPEFLVKALAYIRQELNIRNLPIELLAHVSSMSLPNGGNDYIKAYARPILHRADSVTEFVACVFEKYGHKLNKPQRKILQRRIVDLDEFEVLKYFSNEGGRVVKLRDILRLVHLPSTDIPEWKRNLIKFTLGRPERQQAIDDPSLLEFECDIKPGKRFVDERYDSSLTRDGNTIRGKFNLDAYTYDISKIPKVAKQLEFNQLSEYGERAREIIEKIKVPWNKVLSQFGKTTDKKILWTDLAPTLPMTALLMNLRNILVSGADPTPVIEKLTNEQTIRYSRLLPYQFYRSYVAITDERFSRVNGNDLDGADPVDVGRVGDALNTALELSLWNTPKLSGNSVVVIDTSGSMCGSIDRPRYDRRVGQITTIDSLIQCIEIASLLGVMLHKLSDERGRTMTLSLASDVSPIILSRHDSIITNVQNILRTHRGGATNGHLIPSYLIHKFVERQLNRVIIVTDMQMWDSSFCVSNGFGKAFYNEWIKFAAKHPETYLYFINVNGYGDSQVPPESKNTLTVHGWTDAIFHFIPKFEMGGNGQVDYIQALTPESYSKRKD